MSSEDKLIAEIERRAVNALCWIATDRNEAESQLRQIRDSARELQKMRASCSPNIPSEMTRHRATENPAPSENHGASSGHL